MKVDKITSQRLSTLASPEINIKFASKIPKDFVLEKRSPSFICNPFSPQNKEVKATSFVKLNSFNGNNPLEFTPKQVIKSPNYSTKGDSFMVSRYIGTSILNKTNSLDSTNTITSSVIGINPIVGILKANSSISNKITKSLNKNR